MTSWFNQGVQTRWCNKASQVSWAARKLTLLARGLRQAVSARGAGLLLCFVPALTLTLTLFFLTRSYSLCSSLSGQQSSTLPLTCLFVLTLSSEPVVCRESSTPSHHPLGAVSELVLLFFVFLFFDSVKQVQPAAKALWLCAA